MADTGPFRVKDTETGDEYTVRVVYSDTQKIIDKQAARSDGRHLPAKPNIGKRSSTKSGRSADSSEGTSE